MMNALFFVACAALGTTPHPTRLQLLGRSAENVSFNRQSVSADGKTVHVSAERQGHHIYDVSGPQPVLLSTITDNHILGNHHLDGSTLYTLWGSSEIKIHDVSTPSAPVLVGTISNILCMGAAVYNGHLYALSIWKRSLVVYDISTLASPQKVWEEMVHPSINSLHIVAGHAYIGLDSTQKLVIYDLSTPTVPVRLPYNSFTGSYGTFFIRNVRQVGTRIFFACGRGGVVALDGTNPAAPVVQGRWTTQPDWVNDIAVKGNLIFAAVGGTGGVNSWVRVIDAADPTALRQIDSYNEVRVATTVNIYGDSMYVTGPSYLYHFGPQSTPCETGVQVDGVDSAKVPLQGVSVTLSGVKWTGFQPWMAGAHAFELPTPLPAMSKVELRCCGGEVCEFFFALFHCEACTGPRPAGFVQTLMLDGWEAGSCGPLFGDGFRSTVFRRRVDATGGGDVVLSYTAVHDEIAAVFGGAGSSGQNWCTKPRGPVTPGPGCGARCPSL